MNITSKFLSAVPVLPAIDIGRFNEVSCGTPIRRNREVAYRGEVVIALLGGKRGQLRVPRPAAPQTAGWNKSVSRFWRHGFARSSVDASMPRVWQASASQAAQWSRDRPKPTAAMPAARLATGVGIHSAHVCWPSLGSRTDRHCRCSATRAWTSRGCGCSMLGRRRSAATVECLAAEVALERAARQLSGSRRRLPSLTVDLPRSH